MSQLKKGQSKPLNVTQESRQRFFVGLGWDPHDDISLFDLAKAMICGTDLEHDLDLACYAYDELGRSICRVCAVSGFHTDQTGKIYHSGDNVEGIGDGDDEQISVELKDLDEAIHSLIFVASIKSGHVFNEIEHAVIRIVDAYSNHTLLSHSFSQCEAALSQDCYVFIQVERAADTDKGWVLKLIDEYCPTVTDGDKRAQYLKKYLSA
ncbi:MAG: hypothetical protein CBB87_03935 [Micavibrio sp. TMED27]|nr:hypothetical protein [Micavibrio sp.]OUT91971.1 MAG: hypothetical protein CBB87_03935 [Micavibrio sp. TMED27]|tara:strand:+ start:10751 stop:11374 length:624 start_codon:yes stop_codon:yes gene_type:complete